MNSANENPQKRSDSWLWIINAGALELDLRQLVAPAKTPEKCSPTMMDDVEIGSPSKSDKDKSLFAQQSVRGWWPCSMEKNGKKELGVGAKKKKRFKSV